MSDREDFARSAFAALDAAKAASEAPWQWIADILGTAPSPGDIAERIRALQTAERLASGTVEKTLRECRLYSALVLSELRPRLQDAGHGEAALMVQDEADRLRVKASERVRP